MIHLIPASELPWFVVSASGSGAAVLNGSEHECPDISIMLGEILPGDRVPIHHHTYNEILVFHQGKARVSLREESYDVGPGDIVMVPAGATHGFENVGNETLRQTAFHAASTVEILWDEPR